MKKVLLVDDHSDIRRLVRITLGKDFEVLEASDGATALEIVRRQRPALVVLDVMMPGELDGYQVCERIKSDETLAGVRVVLLTARGQQTDLEQGRKAGCDAYLVKPFSPLELIDKVEELGRAGSA